MTGYRHLYGTRRWRAASAYVVRRAGGRCEVETGCPRPATTADHVVAAAELAEAGRLDLFFDVANLRAACRSCNSRRGAEQVNGGRRGRPRVRRRVTEAERLAEEAERQYWLEVNYRPSPTPTAAPPSRTPRIH